MERSRRMRIVAATACAATLMVSVQSIAYAQAANARPADPTADPGKPVEPSLTVQDTDIRAVLRMLSDDARINIVASKEVSGKITVSLYGLTFEESLDAVLKVAGFEYVRKGKLIYVMTAKEKADWDAAGVTMQVQVFKLNYITAADAQTLITPVLSDKGKVAVSPGAATGVSESDTDTGGNSLAIEDVIVVKDFPEQIEKISEMLKQLDVRPAQVLIEATLLIATLDEDNALGIDFNALAGVDFRTLASTSDPAYSGVTRGALPANRFDKGGGSISTDFASDVIGDGLSMGFIFNEVAVFVRALESITDVVVLANPKLLVVNKQRGEVIVGSRDGYLTTTISEGIATETVEFLTTGTRLVVRPFVASDGYIRMEIHPEDSSGGLSGANLPFEETTECTTNIIVRDGHTIVLGGMFRESTDNERTQVPGLGNIPIIGNLFRSRVEDCERKEMIILITPHIIKHPIDEIVSEQIRDDIRRMRLGARQGLMWFGRSRLAHSHMRWARQHMAKGNQRRALWDVKLALSLEPRLLEALDMKERLTRRTIWSTESRVSSVAYTVQRMILQDLGQPFEKVAVPHKPRDGMELEAEIRQALGIGERTEYPLPGVKAAGEKR